MFASEHFGIEPDILTVAKGLTSGYVPLSAAIATRRVFDAFWGLPEEAFAHAGTYSGHAVACAAALANLAILEREGLVENAANQGHYLQQRLKALNDFEFVGNISGLGLMVSVELVSDQESRAAPNPAIGPFIHEEAYRRGLICRWASPSIYLYPPLCIDRESVDDLVEILVASFEVASHRFGGREAEVEARPEYLRR